MNALARLRQKFWVALAGETGRDALTVMAIVLADLHAKANSSLDAENFAESMKKATLKAIENYAEIVEGM